MDGGVPTLEQAVCSTAMSVVTLSETQLEVAKQKEAEQQKSYLGVRRQSKWTYLSLEKINTDSPSRKDGLDEIKEKRWRREYLHLIQKAGMALKVPQWGIAGAALLCHRFFSRKSMKKNDRFVVATACLHLAGKVEESPKPIREVVRECERIRYVKNQLQLRRLGDPAYLEEAKENVLMAERAVLYTLGFDLNITHPYTFLMQQFTSLDLGNVQQLDNPFRHLMQNTWNFINDSFRTTLCIQFTPEKLACAALFLANELNKLEYGRGVEEVIRAKIVSSGSFDFCKYFQITRAEIEAITHQMLEVYEQSKLSQTTEAPLPAAAATDGSRGNPAHAQAAASAGPGSSPMVTEPSPLQHQGPAGPWRPKMEPLMPATPATPATPADGINDGNAALQQASALKRKAEQSAGEGGNGGYAYVGKEPKLEPL